MGLIKVSANQTNYYLPVKVLTNKGYVQKIRYYDNEFVLFKAYRQLKSINSSRLVPLYPVVFGQEVRHND